MVDGFRYWYSGADCQCWETCRNNSHFEAILTVHSIFAKYCFHIALERKCVAVSGRTGVISRWINAQYIYIYTMCSNG